MISTKENENMKNNRRCLHIIFTIVYYEGMLFIVFNIDYLLIFIN